MSLEMQRETSIIHPREEVHDRRDNYSLAVDFGLDCITHRNNRVQAEENWRAALACFGVTEQTMPSRKHRLRDYNVAVAALSLARCLDKSGQRKRASRIVRVIMEDRRRL